ncbi:MAG: hypothetical protein R2748_25895 [Bryobacterales bacterium]
MRIQEALTVSQLTNAQVLVLVRDEAAADGISALLTDAELTRVQYLWNLED